MYHRGFYGSGTLRTPGHWLKKTLQSSLIIVFVKRQGLEVFQNRLHSSSIEFVFIAVYIFVYIVFHIFHLLRPANPSRISSGFLR
jgi:hypothetical protein